MGRYRFYEANNKIICVSTFAKKDVKGVAKCSPEDKFDIKIGYELARLRCDEKVALKRLEKARKRYTKAVKEMNVVKNEFDSACIYLSNSSEDYTKAMIHRKEFEKILKKT